MTGSVHETEETPTRCRHRCGRAETVEIFEYGLGRAALIGFQLTELVEWGPSASQIAERPHLASEHERPAFLLIGVQR